MMDIYITQHAVKRYRERLFDYSSSQDEIIKRLENIARYGKTICLKPNDKKNCTEIRHQGISIVAIKEGENLIIITCLGEDRYRRWIKAKGADTYLSQSILFSNAC